DGRTRGRDLRHQIEQCEHLLTFPDDARKVVPLLQRALELNVLFAQPAPLNGERNRSDKFVIRPWFRDVVLRPALERGARHIDRAKRSNQDYGKVGIAAADFAEQVNPVAVGKAYIEEHQVEGPLLELSQTCVARFSNGNVEAFGSEKLLQA